MITVMQIERDYPHRVAVDPKHCPVCCGSGRTTDPHYGFDALEVNAPSRVYECGACDVWATRGMDVVAQASTAAAEAAAEMGCDDDEIQRAALEAAEIAAEEEWR